MRETKNVYNLAVSGGQKPPTACFCRGLYSLFLVEVIESSEGSGVAVLVEVHDVFVLHIVTPLEFEVQASLHAHQCAGDGQGQGIALDVELAYTHLLPGEAACLDRGDVPLDDTLALGGIDAVDGQIIALPARGLGAVGVQKQGHPAVALAGRDGVGALDEEVEILRVAGDLGLHDIIATRVVDVVTACEAIPIAVDGGTLGVAVHGGDLLPLGLATADVDALRLGDFHAGLCALVTADVVGELEIVGVQIAVTVHLDVTAMLAVVLVHHGELRRIGIGQPGLLPLTHDPLVPARDEHQVGIHVDGAIPLLLYVIAVFVGVLGEQVVPVLVGVASAKGTHVVEVGADAILVGVLSHAHGHHLAGAVGTLAILVLREDLQPAPLVGMPGAAAVARLTGAEAEELLDLAEDAVVGLADTLLGKHAIVSHDHGLAVLTVPQVRVKARLVEVLVQGIEHGGGGFGNDAQVQHEHDLRGTDAVQPGFVHPLEQGLVGVAPKQGTVGAVKGDHIHACR